jgi:hypothetical protein
MPRPTSPSSLAVRARGARQSPRGFAYDRRRVTRTTVHASGGSQAHQRCIESSRMSGAEALTIHLTDSRDARRVRSNPQRDSVATTRQRGADDTRASRSLPTPLPSRANDTAPPAPARQRDAAHVSLTTSPLPASPGACAPPAPARYTSRAAAARESPALVISRRGTTRPSAPLTTGTSSASSTPVSRLTSARSPPSSAWDRTEAPPALTKAAASTAGYHARSWRNHD